MKKTFIFNKLWRSDPGYAFVLLLGLGTLMPATSAVAEVEVLLESQTSWNGGEFKYPSGPPRVTAVKVTLNEGQETPFHCHPVPTLGYLLKGELEVETGSGQKIVLTEGKAAIEVMNTSHRGKAINGAVEILVFYAGALDIENTLSVDDPGCN